MSKRMISIMALALIILGLSTFALKIQPARAIVGDLNDDGVVDIEDLIIAAQAFGCDSGDVRWNAEADLNSDGRISIMDLCIIAKNFG